MLVNPQVDPIFSQWDSVDSPGCALGVIHQGQMVYRHNYGMAQPSPEIPISSDTIFYIASMGKQFTAMSILLLEEQGRLSLNDDIRQHIPEFPDYGSPITIEDLIHHTSGIKDYLLLWVSAGGYINLASVYSDIGSLDEQKSLDLLSSQTALDFAPGTNFQPRKLPDCPEGVRTLQSSSPTIMTPVLAEGRGRVHLGMMAGDHFPRKNAWLTPPGMCEKYRFSEKRTHFGQFLGAVLRTQC